MPSGAVPVLHWPVTVRALMDIVIQQDEERMSFTAISKRAILLFEDRMGVGTRQISVEGNPEEVLGKLPPDWVLVLTKNNLH